jgi:HAAS
MQTPLNRYLAQLGRSLVVDESAKAAILEETRAHLEEKTAAYIAEGMERAAAEERAVREFGPPEVVGRALNAAHPTRLRQALAIAGQFLLGFTLAPLLWLLCAFPFVMLYAYRQGAIIPGLPDLPTHLLEALAPQTGWAVDGVVFGGWTQLDTLALVYSILPFYWGARERSWWTPGLAYGAGLAAFFAWMTIPTWFIDPQFLPHIQPYAGLSVIFTAVLPLSLLAAWLGSRWSAWRRQPAMRARSVAPFLRMGVNFPLALLLIFGAEASSFIAVRAYVSQPPLSLDQQLAGAQAHVSFHVSYPQRLPASKPLTQVLVHPLYDFNFGYGGEQWVWLTYGERPDDVFISQSNRPEIYSTEIYSDASISPPLPGATLSRVSLYSAQATLMALPQNPEENSAFRRVNLFWVRDDVYYQVSSSALTGEELTDVARGLT